MIQTLGLNEIRCIFIAYFHLVVYPIEAEDFTNGYRGEGTRGGKVIIIEGSSVVGFLISLPSPFSLDIFLG
jgi:hypothetical protein